MRGRSLWWVLITCLACLRWSGASAAVDVPWRDHDRRFSALTWTDAGAAIGDAKSRMETARREGRTADELRAQADFLTVSLPFNAEHLAMASEVKQRAQTASEAAIAFDVTFSMGVHNAITHAAPVDAAVQELRAAASRLGDPAREAMVDQLLALEAIYTGRGGQAVPLLTRALDAAPHEFRRIELLLLRVDAMVLSSPDSPAAIDRARADLHTALAIVDPNRYRTFGFQAYASLGRLERSVGNVDDGIAALRKAQDIAPASMVGSRDYSTVQTGLALALMSKNRHGEALKVLDGIAIKDDFGPADRLTIATARARAIAAIAGPDAAAQSVAWLDKAAVELARLGNEPRMVHSYHRTAAEVYERTGQYAKALAAWKDVEKAASERSKRANEKLRLELQGKLDLATKERQNAELLARADLESERRLRWSWAFGISALSALGLSWAWARSVRQKRRLAELSGTLARQNEQLEERSSSRIRLLAAACHDLRQPAHALGLLAELGVDAVRAPDTSRTWLQSIKRCSTTLSEMLGELMDLSRLDGGHYTPVIDRVSLDELMHDARLQFSDTARLKNLSLDAPPCGLFIASDRQLVRRMLFNLVSNAVKYTQEGSVTVTASVQDGEVAVVVADTGPGIPPERIHEVFQDHVRLDPRQATDGLGIGLSIVRRAAQLLGHDVALDSVVGQGTRFTLKLGAPLPVTESLTSPAGDTAPMIGNGASIALVENDDAIRSAMAAVLSKWGYTPACAGSVDELIRTLPETDFKLIVTDLHLEGHDGFAAVEALRQHTGRPDLPALLVTGDLDASVAARAAAENIQLSHKPLPPMRLLTMVNLALAATPTGAFESAKHEATPQAGAAAR